MAKAIALRPLAPLAVCFLVALTLADQFDVSFLHPRLDPAFEPLLGGRNSFEADLLDPPKPSGDTVKLTAVIDGVTILLTAEAPAALDLQPGDRIRFSTRLKRPTHYQNPGGFDYRRYLERRGIVLTGYVKEGDLEVIERATDTAGLLARTICRVRGGIGSLLEREIGGTEAGFLKALLTGDYSGLTPALWEDFRRTGTAHLVAISGQHIGMIAIASFAVLFWLLKRSRRLLLTLSVRKAALVLTILPVIFYTLLAGSPPSAVRAAILSVLVVLAVLSGRDIDPLSAIAAAAIVIPIIDPSAPFSASFQLSFLAVLGILLFRSSEDRAATAQVVPEGPEDCLRTPQAVEFRRDRKESPGLLRKYIVNPFWMSLGATLATGPLVAYLFHKVSLSGLLTNAWAIPFSGLLLILGGALTGLAAILSPWASTLLAPIGLLARLFLKLLHVSSEYSWVVSFYPTERELFFCLAGVALLAWIRQRPSDWRAATVCGGLLLVTAVFPAGIGPVHFPKNEFSVTFLDVGEGDAALVTTPSGKSLLVDGGGFLIPGPAAMREGRFDVGAEVVVPYLKRLGLKRIDTVLLSHPHPDHYGGLKAVFESFPVGEFWWSGQSFPDESFDRLLDLIRTKRVPTRILKDGDRFPWGEGEAEVYYPDRIDLARKINDNSVVVRLDLGGEGVLFPGDVEKVGEQFLQETQSRPVAILKIPHHGSRTSSSIPFIDWARPQFAIASLGEGNMFGFPHEGILERYERRGAKVYRTDRVGAVTFTWSRGFPRRSPSIRTVSSRR